jgi:hypothetical protein
LASYDQDHNSRNLVSYRPSEFRRAAAVEPTELCAFIEDLWRSFEPSEGDRFPVIERHLLRRALSAGGVPLPLSPVALNPVGLSKAQTESWLTVLNGTSEPALFREAQIQSAIEDARCHLQVISRAALLLYLATTVARRQLSVSGYTRGDLHFWWRLQGIDRGLWDISREPANPLDLWADVVDLLDESKTFVANNSPGLSLYAWRHGQSRAVESLGAYELVGIWGLLP